MRGRLRILLVERNEKDREAYRLLIQKGLGNECEVVEADCGESGLKRCHATTPDCVLSNWDLPDIDGFEFVKSLRSEAKLSAIPIVFLIEESHGPVAEQAMNFGAHDYLHKSAANVDSLRLALRSATEKARLTREIERQHADLERQRQFLAKLAHEFRNSLTPIRNMAALLRRLPRENPTVQTAGDTIERKVEHLTRMMDDLLDLLHGGDVDATSSTGQEERFASDSPLGGAQAASQPKPHIFNPRTRRVLLVEDDPLVGESVRMLLGSMGQDVRLATSGEEAVPLAREFRPDLVLCDIGLPGEMDGYAVARALRQEKALHGAHLVALSGYGHKEAVAKAHAAGFDRHLTKPISEAALEQLLTERG